jgi:hypothetical protein
LLAGQEFVADYLQRDIALGALRHAPSKQVLLQYLALLTSFVFTQVRIGYDLAFDRMTPAVEVVKLSFNLGALPAGTMCVRCELLDYGLFQADELLGLGALGLGWAWLGSWARIIRNVILCY